MKMKSSELTGAALDWAVLKASNKAIGQPDHLPFNVEWLLMRDAGDFQYSTNWAQGGPIIEREKIELEYGGFKCWWARIKADEDPAEYRKRFDAALTEVEQQADSIWNDTHGCESCVAHWTDQGLDIDNSGGLVPVYKYCPDCNGSGAVI